MIYMLLIKSADITIQRYGGDKIQSVNGIFQNLIQVFLINIITF